MSIENTIISRSLPSIVANRAKEVLIHEASKGCLPELSFESVNLEPVFLPQKVWNKMESIQHYNFVPDIQWPTSDLERFTCWISSDYSLQWFRAERFVKELLGISHRVGYEIIGNEGEITFRLLVHKNDLELVQVAFNGEYSDCELTISNNSDHFCNNIYFYDFFPIPPYHHLLTQSPELTTSPYETFINAIAKFPGPDKGFVQVLFEPVKNNWHQNVEKLTDIEFLGKTTPDTRFPYKAQQQLPSGDIRNMAIEVEKKAHNDKPFYFTALRTGIITSKTISNAWALAAFTSLFQHGGKSLQYLSEKDYKQLLTQNQICKMLNNGYTYKPGFLLNSSELAGLVHLPSYSIFEKKDFSTNLIEALSLPHNQRHVDSDINIGTCSYAGNENPVYIDSTLRKRSTHIIGRPGTGKTTTIEHMILQDIDNNQGLALIDPHGDLINRLLTLIPENKTDSTIYLDFGDDEWIPLFNPLKRIDGQSVSRTADDLVVSIKSIIKSHSWGDRLEHLLRNGFNGLLHIDNSTFFDLLVLFEQSNKKSDEKKQLKNRILNAVDNEVSKRFWKKDFDNYKRDDFAPPHHKLSKLLNADESVSLMLTQPDNLINFKEIMDTGKILLLDLSNVGPDTRKILGCFLLSFLHNTALSRNKIDPENRIPFNIYGDEAHKLTTYTLEDMIAESRKFGVNLTLAHQYLNQFSNSQRDALSSVGTTIIFNVDISDAYYLTKDLQEKVKAKDLSVLDIGQAIARIGTDIIKINTPRAKALPFINFKDKIVKRSRELYYRRAEEIKLHQRKKQNNQIPDYYHFVPDPMEYDIIPEERPKLYYDEFK